MNGRRLNLKTRVGGARKWGLVSSRLTLAVPSCIYIIPALLNILVSFNTYYLLTCPEHFLWIPLWYILIVISTVVWILEWGTARCRGGCLSASCVQQREIGGEGGRLRRWGYFLPTPRGGKQADSVGMVPATLGACSAAIPPPSTVRPAAPAKHIHANISASLQSCTKKVLCALIIQNS